MAGLPAQNSRVVKIPLPSNVDPSWRFKLELCDLNDGRYSDGFHAGAYVGVPAHDREAREMAMTLDMHIRNGSTIQAIPLNSDNSLSQYQYVTRSALPGEKIDFNDTRTQVHLITPQTWGSILVDMIMLQRNWWMDRMAQTEPYLWGDGSIDPVWRAHPVWRAWAAQPDPNRLWYVAIRRTLPDDINDIPAYYFPEAELRF
ncbi:hypothetical protein K466DRAFT_654320 [Polyporus arcularius HHB13444]|uniref:Uncharacterized protein n=1 Tax=Polyporus arcularius HHB13444 TaxID=1314778 RepID=A0A5C3P9M0_9APHY|nr:hypothetical protein K466DRAFT_654320 [Polyporus arcularius HHB13444]